MEHTEKIYFYKGELVKVRHNLLNVPIMMVDKVNLPKDFTRGGEEKGKVKRILQGVQCIWFDKNGTLNEHNFNTKDLVKVNK